MGSNSDIFSLVERAQLGDRAAFEHLVGEVEARLESFIRSRLGIELRSRVEVLDVLQETLLRAYRDLNGFSCRHEDSLLAWLSGIAEHVILETASRVRRDPALPLDQEVAAEGATPSKILRRDERFERLQSALESLSPDHREVICLVRVEGLPVREAAKKMKRTPHAVSNLLLRATQKLKEILGDTESLSLPDRPLKRSEGHGEA